MSKEHPDCIGDGRYYRIGSLDPLDSEGDLTTRISDTGIVSHSDSRTDIRFDPDTGEAYCLSAIIADLRNRDWNIRIQAAWELGSKGDVEGVLPLIEALKDDHRQVREMAHEALLGLESSGEPLPVRVLLCDTVEVRERTDILIGMANARARRARIFGFGAVKEYCENVLEEQGTSALSADEQAVLDRLKRSAAAVLAELSRRADSVVLLRAGERDGGMHKAQLLRSAVEDNRSDEAERLLRAVEER